MMAYKTIVENRISLLEPVFTMVKYYQSVVKCVVKNSARTYMVCDGQNRNDAIRNMNQSDESESLSLLVKRDDFVNKNMIYCHCIAISKNSNSQVFSNQAVVNKAYLEGDFLSEPMDEIAYVDDSIELRCDPPHGEPKPFVYWLKDNVIININLDNKRIKVSNDFSLLILSAKKEDAGAYTCVAKNEAGVSQSNPAKLELLDKSQKYIWSEWSSWSSCPLTCDGNKTSKRYRHCQTTNKIAQLEKVPLYMCNKDKSFEIKECPIINCVQTKWSDWSEWSQCSIQCKQYRYRNCNTENSMNLCNEEKLMIRQCNETRCKVGRFKNIISHNNFNGLQPDYRSKIENKIETAFNGSNENRAINGFPFGIIAIILASLFLITCIALIFSRKILKKKSYNKKYKTKSELDIYYIYEKQIEHGKSLLLYLNNKANINSLYSENSQNNADTINFPKTSIYQNNLFENEKLYRNHYDEKHKNNTFSLKVNQSNNLSVEVESKNNNSFQNQNYNRFQCQPITLKSYSKTNADEQIYEIVDR